MHSDDLVEVFEIYYEEDLVKCFFKNKQRMLIYKLKNILQNEIEAISKNTSHYDLQIKIIDLRNPTQSKVKHLKRALDSKEKKWKPISQIFEKKGAKSIREKLKKEIDIRMEVILKKNTIS